MYKLKVKDAIYTIPKANIRMLAISKAMELKQNVAIKTDDEAIDFLKSLGIEVIE